MKRGLKVEDRSAASSRQASPVFDFQFSILHLHTEGGA